MLADLFGRTSQGRYSSNLAKKGHFWPMFAFFAEPFAFS
jgi:hypothetical protein